MNFIKYVPMLIVPAIGARRPLASSPPSASSLLPTPTKISTDCYPQSVGNGSIVPEHQTNLTNCIEMIPGLQYPRLCTDDNHSITRTPLYPFNFNDGSAQFGVSVANETKTTDCNPGMLFSTAGGPAELVVCADGGNGTNKAPNVVSAKNESGGIVVSVYNAPGSGKKEACNEIVGGNSTKTTCYDTSQRGQSAIVFADTTEPQPPYCGSTTSPPEPTETQNSTQTGSQNSGLTGWGIAGIVAGSVTVITTLTAALYCGYQHMRATGRWPWEASIIPALPHVFMPPANGASDGNVALPPPQQANGQEFELSRMLSAAPQQTSGGGPAVPPPSAPVVQQLQEQQSSSASQASLQLNPTVVQPPSGQLQNERLDKAIATMRDRAGVQQNAITLRR
jgi:hypothetical protein